MTTDTRLNEVEHELERMSRRVRRLESEVGRAPAPRPAAPAPSGPATIGPGHEFRPAPPLPEPFRARPARGASFEEVFGGRVLAWIGGLAILIGAVLFMGMAISRGWLDEETRTVIGMLGSLGLLLAGIWLHESKGRSEAARAAVASGISGLYVTLVVATQVYELIPPGVGLLLAALIAAAGMAIAVRWSSQLVAAIGSLGALGAPLLVDVGDLGSSLGFVLVALVAVTGIVVWQRWGWLVLGAFAVSAPQLIAWIAANQDGEGTVPLVLIALFAFWALYLAGAFGYELRSREPGQLPVASLVQLFASSALVVGAGYQVLDATGAEDAAVVWMFGCSALLAALGGLALRLSIHREIGSLLIGVGIGVSALAFAAALSGPALVIAWAAEAVVFAYLATRVDSREDTTVSSSERLLIVAGTFFGLAVTHTLIFEAPPQAMFEGVESLGESAAALGACVAAALAGGLLARRAQPAAPQVAGFAAGALLVYLGSVVIVDTIGVDAYGDARQSGQVWLSVFWTVTGLAAVVWGLVRKAPSVRLGGLALLGVAIAKVWTYDLSELDELARVLSFVGLGLLLLVGAFAYQRIKPGEEVNG